jgi:regulator of protease activity HflC (stomatin/prohibitin superfamily)
MFRLIVALILLAPAFYLIFKGRFQTQPEIPESRLRSPQDAKYLDLRWVGYILAGVAVLIALTACFYKLDVGEAAVLKSVSGTVQGSKATPGFGTKAPWVDVIKFNIRNQVVTFAGDGRDDSDDGPAITTQTSDNASVQMDITIRYSLDPSKVENIYRQYSDQDGLLAKVILPGIRSVVRDAPTTFPAATIRQQRPQLSGQVSRDLNASLNSAGVLVDQVDLRNIGLDKGVEASLNAVQQARAKADSARADLETAKINAEKIKTEAQAQSDSDQIIRCGATSQTVDEVVNGQTVKAIKVVPVPQAQCQNRLNQQVLTSKYIDMLRAAAEKGNTIYVVPQGANNIISLSAPQTTK